MTSNTNKGALILALNAFQSLCRAEKRARKMEQEVSKYVVQIPPELMGEYLKATAEIESNYDTD